MEQKFNLSTPWAEYYRELEALFKHDPAIKIGFDEDEYIINLYVDGGLKAEALAELLPSEKVFGNVTLKVNVIPANVVKDDKTSLFKAAFEGNPVFSYAVKPEGILVPNFSFVVFKNEVVQYFNDNLGDVNGNRSTLYQEIAKDVFEDHEGVFFCTDTPKE